MTNPSFVEWALTQETVIRAPTSDDGVLADICAQILNSTERTGQYQDFLCRLSSNAGEEYNSDVADLISSLMMIVDPHNTVAFLDHWTDCVAKVAVCRHNHAALAARGVGRRNDLLRAAKLLAAAKQESDLLQRLVEHDIIRSFDLESGLSEFAQFVAELVVCRSSDLSKKSGFSAAVSKLRNLGILTRNIARGSEGRSINGVPEALILQWLNSTTPLVRTVVRVACYEGSEFGRAVTEDADLARWAANDRKVAKVLGAYFRDWRDGLRYREMIRRTSGD